MTTPAHASRLRLVRHRGSYIEIYLLVRPVQASSSVVPPRLEQSHDSTNPLYASGLPTHWVIPVLTQTTIPFARTAHFAPSSSAPALPPPPSPQTQTPESDRRSGTQKEEHLIQLERCIISSPWYAANALEPICGSPDCPYLADCYGVRGMSCYTAFVVAKPGGTFGCWREGCSAYSARQIAIAVKHQRTNHFNHKPFLCVPVNGIAW